MGIAITIWLLGGFVSAALARARRRSVRAWFASGMLLPVVGGVLVLILPSAGLRMVYTVEVVRKPEFDGGAGQTIVAQRTHLQTATLDAVARLVRLKESGSISEWEFQERRAELLARI